MSFHRLSFTVADDISLQVLLEAPGPIPLPYCLHGPLANYSSLWFP
jgi:hypothetical protein